MSVRLFVCVLWKGNISECSPSDHRELLEILSEELKAAFIQSVCELFQWMQAPLVSPYWQEKGEFISHMSTEICNTSLTIIFVSWKKSPLDSDRASSSLCLIFCVLSFRVTEGKAVEIVVGMTLLRFWSKWAGGNDQGLTVSPCFWIS